MRDKELNLQHCSNSTERKFSCIYVCIARFLLKDQDGKIINFMYLPIIDLASGWSRMVEPSAIPQLIEKDRQKTIRWMIDKLSAEVARLFNQQWLRRYSRAKYIIHENGSEFKLNFESLSD